ncbi:Rrf2 family transcriptional regulator [Brochothrix thermosphacta]|uniref:RrF2 family transcriptional regulator n=1 Tax=Brochothrix thermosphacta TaxID=2756 RepID=UPI000D102257|nr:Rrf2 family transcriptional regulator [Brochothrix thermosphacta]SOC19477.1 Rrf2 family transcriptional regulator [Brochothrix thermosphacta]
MKYSKATNYALHAMLSLANKTEKTSIGVQSLATELSVSTTYLSKILAKLVKEGLVLSSSGAQGGYSLAANKNDVSFLDVIQAIEGKASLFECDPQHGEHCLVHQVMLEAETEMERQLKQKRIIDVAYQIK